MVPPSKMHDSVSPGGRLIVVANRLPITVKRTGNGSFKLSISSGGLVTGLSGLSKSTEFEWYGWPGLSIPEGEVDVLKSQLKQEYDAVPVLLSESLADKHYNGFSSRSSSSVVVVYYCQAS